MQRGKSLESLSDTQTNQGIYYLSLCLYHPAKKRSKNPPRANPRVFFTKLTVSYLQLTNFFCSGFNTWPKLALRVDLQQAVTQNLVVVRLRIIYRGLPLAFSDNGSCFCTSAAQGPTISITESIRLSDTPEVKKGNNLLDLQSAVLILKMILSIATFPFPDGKLLPSYNTEIRNSIKSAAVVFFILLCFYSPQLFFPFLGLYTGINYLNFLLSWSCRSPVITKRGIRLQRNLPAANSHYLPKQSRQQKFCITLPQACPAHCDTVLLSHSALGMRHLLGFHLLPLTPKSPLSLIQTKPSYPGSYSLLWTATSLNLRKAKKFFYCHYFQSGCLQVGPRVCTSPGDMLLFEHSPVHCTPTCWPGTSAPTSHPGAELGSGLMLHCPVWLCCCSLSSLLVFSSLSKLEIYPQKEPGESSQPHPQTALCSLARRKSQHLLSFSQPATNLLLFSSHVSPSLATSTQQLFPACCEKQVFTCHFSLL